MSSPDNLSPYASKITRVVFTALLLDLLAFTIILPLLPRLLQHYLILEDGDKTTILNRTLYFIRIFKSQLTPELASDVNAKWDIVLLGGLLGSLFSFLQFIAAPIIGRMSDRWGRRRTLLFTMAGNIISTGVWMFSNTFELFLLARIIGGLSEGNVQLSIAIISDITTKETRSRGLAMVGIAFAIAFTVGPALGAFFATRNMTSSFPALVEWGLNPYSAPALLGLVFLTIETIYLFFALPETHHYSVVQSSSKNASKSDGSPKPAKEPLPTSTRLRNLTTLNITHALYLFLFSGMEFTLTFLTFDLLDFSHMQQGRLLGYIGILSSLVQGGYVRRRASKIGERAIVLQGIASCSLGLFAITYMPFTNLSVSIRLLYLGATFLAFTSATVVNGLTALASMQCDPEDAIESDPRLARGRALGSFRAAGQLGRAVGPIAACVMYWIKGPVWCYGTGAGAMAIIWAICILAVPRGVKVVKVE